MPSGTPVLLDEAMRPVEPISSWFRKMALDGLDPKSVRSYAYTVLMLLNFLRRGVWTCDPPVSVTCRSSRLWRREEADETIGEATWDRDAAAIGGLYHFLVQIGFVDGRPWRSTRRGRGRSLASGTSRDVRVRHMELEQYLCLRDVGFGGLAADAGLDGAFRGWRPHRNRAACEPALMTDMRIQEWATLLLPELGLIGGARPRTTDVDLAACAKYGGARSVYVPSTRWTCRRLPDPSLPEGDPLPLIRAGGRPRPGRALLTMILAPTSATAPAGSRSHRGYQRTCRCVAAAIPLREIGSRGGEAASLGSLAEAFYLLGRFEDAMDHATRALAACRQSGDRGSEAEDMRMLAAIYLDAGRHAEAVALAHAALAQAREVASRRLEARALNTIATIHLQRGDHKQAIEDHQAALELAKESDGRWAEIETHIGLANSNCQLGRHECARTQAQLARSIAQRTGYKILEGQAMTAAAAVHLAQGKPDSAIQGAGQALAIHRETGHRLGEARTLHLLGEAHARTGQAEAARRHWQDALELLTDIGTAEADQIRDPLARANHRAR